MRRIGHVRSARAAARTLERVDFWQRRRPCADALGQAGPIVGTALRDRGRRERLLVERRESGRRQAAVQHAPSQLVVSPQCEHYPSRRAPVALARLGRPEDRLDACRELYGYRCCESCPCFATTQRFARISKAARYARALCIAPGHKRTDYSREIVVERPALDAWMFDCIEETGIDRFIIALVVHGAFGGPIAPSRRVKFGRPAEHEASCTCGKGRSGCERSVWAFQPSHIQTEAPLELMSMLLSLPIWLIRCVRPPDCTVAAF